MSITTYAELQTAAGTWLNRSDLTSQIPDFIALAEAKFKRDLAGGTTITALSGGSPTNWLLTSHPDVYLYGTLMEAAPYLKDDERVVIWKGLLAEAVEGVRRSRTSTAYDLTTYAGLQTAIKGFLDRFDVDPAAFVTLAEARLKKDPRVKRLENQGAFAVDAETETLPSDFHSLEALYHNGGSYFGPLDIVGADMLGTIRGTYGGASGVPRYAAVVEGSLHFAPVPDVSYSLRLVYWQTITPLSSWVNWLLTSHPDIYLFASLCEAAPYVKDPAMVPLWEQKLEAALEALRVSHWTTQFGGGTMRRQIRAIG